MKKRHIVPLVILAFLVVVGGILLVIGTQKNPRTGLDTSHPNGSAPVHAVTVR